MKRSARLPEWAARILDALDEPAVVNDARGRTLFANTAARAGDVAEQAAGGRTAAQRRARVRLAGRATIVVVRRAVELARAPDVRWPLPRSLSRVATLASSGLSDSAIAASTGLSLATVRTYVTRIYERLGVRSRAELAQWRPPP